MHKALKPFGWYPDGHTREALEIGDERDFGDVTDGLVAAKMIAPVGVVKATSTKIGYEAQGSYYDKDAVGHERVGMDSAPAEPTDEPIDEPADDDQPKRRGRGRK